MRWSNQPTACITLPPCLPPHHNRPQFLDALDLVAAKKGQPITEVVRQVVATQGPALHSTTKAEAVRFHDDPSTYTGVAARRASLSSTGSGPAARRRSSVGGGTPASRLAAPRANSRNSTPRPSLGAEVRA